MPCHYLHRAHTGSIEILFPTPDPTNQPLTSLDGGILADETLKWLGAGLGATISKRHTHRTLMSALYFLPLMMPSNVGFSLSLKFSVTSYTALTEKQAHDNVVVKGHQRIRIIHV